VNRSFKSKLKQHYYTSMKHYDGVIDKAQKQSANKINMEVLCRLKRENSVWKIPVVKNPWMKKVWLKTVNSLSWYFISYANIPVWEYPRNACRL
jgi:hypothetical protein